MSDSMIDYQSLLVESMRRVVREVLEGVAKDGLPGGHHFYLTFRTDHEGVALSAGLRGQYPDTMTIILQHQFEQLEVTDDAVAATLFFGGQPERIVIPWSALVSFHDPAASFSLNLLHESDSEETLQESSPSSASQKREGEVVDLAARRAELAGGKSDA